MEIWLNEKISELYFATNSTNPKFSGLNLAKIKKIAVTFKSKSN